MLEALAKARHPDAKPAAKASAATATAAEQAPGTQEASKKRRCEPAKPAHMRANGGESASLPVLRRYAGQVAWH